MADLPALFSGPMVRSILADLKDQTRRANHLERLRRFGPITEFGPSDTAGYDWHFRDKDKRWHDLRHAELLKVLPWQVGDRLYVRETWAPLDRLTHNDPGAQALSDRCFYQADGSTVAGEITRWTPSIHMPRRYSRLTLTITDVRIQRLQDISETDALAEGAYVAPKSGRVADSYAAMALAGDWFATGRAWYRDLWDRINGYGSWDANPWVAAYTFTVQRGNIDTLAGAA